MYETDCDIAVRAMDRRAAVLGERIRMRWMYTVISIGLFLIGFVAGYFYAIEKCLY
jgi:hypothetical protein